METKFSIEPLERNDLGKLKGGFTSSSGHIDDESMGGSVSVSVRRNCSCSCSAKEL